MRSLLPLTVLALACSGSAPEPPPARVDPTGRLVVLVVIDTLRGDAVEAARTPTIDRIAAKGDRVERAWAAGTWTVPSTISLFSGMPVRSHGWNESFFKMGEGAKALPDAPDDIPFLAEVLSEHGVQTHGQYVNPLIGKLGLDRGFDDLLQTGEAKMAKRLRKRARSWDPAADHFLYLHYMGPHSPLKPRKVSADRWNVPAGSAGPYTLKEARGASPEVVDTYRRAYHAVVEDSDFLVGRALHALGPWAKDAVVIITSDHGELLGEHGIHGHSRYVWEPLTHVPLVAKGLGDLPDTMVTTGLAARITDVYGIEHAWPEAGQRTLPLVSQREDKLAISPDGRQKAIWDERDLADQGGFASFDLSVDPLEERPLARELRPTFDAVRATWEAETPAGEAVTTDEGLTDEMADMLDQLGYLEQ